MFTPMAWLVLLALLVSTGLWSSVALAGPPGPTEINGHKVLTLISRDPPALRCNNNIQVAAELSNIYKLPIIVIPVTAAGPGARAPAVYYGSELVTVDGGAGNGMVHYTELADILELEGVPLQEEEGLLIRLSDPFEKLKAAIRGD
ncbi:hypothetical protein B1C78_03410 [Thioalkalivibrio denitrificans]|uniref:Uncharacterized protein n=2 Tax=Thioalkalivibrio denitrificans TaxID=108003 RepID=A0A1V3NSJ6_9GAMM|nr:hypothetical protein B1C78_03410 [Thioalkalivibrio denitrificans]